MAPPAGGAAQPHQPRRLGWQAVRGHQLLLFADRAEEAEGVDAEPDHAHERDRQQAERRARRHAPALAPARRRKHEEGQRKPGRDLHAHAHRQSAGARAHACICTGGQRQGAGQGQQQQRVVVRPPDGQRQQHRVQAHERGRPACRQPDAVTGARDQGHRADARRDRHRLERPQGAGKPQRGGRIAGKGEQRAVGRMQKRPADELEHRVGRRFGGDVRVRVQPMQRAHAREGHVAEHVLGDQWRAQRHGHVRQRDPRQQRTHAQRARGHEDQQIAGAHDQHVGLEAVAAQAHVQALQRASQPAGPAPAARRHVLRRACGRARAQQKRARQHAEQAHGANRALDLYGGARAPCLGRPLGPGSDPHAGCGSRRLDRPIVAPAGAPAPPCREQSSSAPASLSVPRAGGRATAGARSCAQPP